MQGEHATSSLNTLAARWRASSTCKNLNANSAPFLCVLSHTAQTVGSRATFAKLATGARTIESEFSQKQRTEVDGGDDEKVVS